MKYFLYFILMSLSLASFAANKKKSKCANIFEIKPGITKKKNKTPKNTKTTTSEKEKAKETKTTEEKAKETKELEVKEAKELKVKEAKELEVTEAKEAKELEVTEAKEAKEAKELKVKEAKELKVKETKEAKEAKELKVKEAKEAKELKVKETKEAKELKVKETKEAKVTEAKEKEEILKIRNKAKVDILSMFEKTLVLPRLSDLANYMDVPQDQLEKAIGPKISIELWEEINKENPTSIEKFKSQIARAFIASFKEHHVTWGNTTPDVKRLYEIYIKKSAIHTVTYPIYLKKEHHLNALLGNLVPDDKLNGAVPVLFPEGIEGVEQFAKKFQPNAFTNYKNSTLHNLKYDKETAEMVLKAKGAIISSVTATIPIHTEFFEDLLTYAEKKGFPIILIPTNNQTEGLDPYLMSMPDKVRIITHSIEFSNYIKIANIPIMPKNANTLAGLTSPNQRQIGQSIIVGNPQLRYATKPTADNEPLTQSYWSTGSISQDLYPSKNPSSQRIGNHAKYRHNLAALVFELSDKSSGPVKKGKGTPGYYHIRPIEFIKPGNKAGLKGIIDLNNIYHDGTVTKTSIDTMVIGDLHDHNTNQTLLQVHEDVIKKMNIKTLVLHDALDGNSHNHHEAKRLNSQVVKQKKGELNIKREVEGLIQTMNGLLTKFPDLNLVIVDSNHNYWIENLLNDPKSLKDLENRSFLQEINFGTSFLEVSVFEFLFNHHREELHKGLPKRISHEFSKNNIYISDPDRVKILNPGEPYIVGPDSNPVHLNFHGHRGSNGGRGSPATHAAATNKSVIGDSHTPSLINGTTNVGVSTKKALPYTLGGYSSWQNAFALVDSDTGNTQLIIYEPLTGLSWRQKKENGFLPQSQQPTPVVVETDNEIAPPDANIPDQYTQKRPSK